MRKRIVIGLLAVVVIGLGVTFFVSEPKKGTVKYHRDQYIKLLTETTRVERLREMWRKLWGQSALVPTVSDRAVNELALHEKALVRLGFFEERRFLVFNRRSEEVMMRAVGLWRITQSNAIVRPHSDAVFIVAVNAGIMGSVRSIGKNSAGALAQSLIIVTEPGHMPQWADFVQRSDSGGLKRWEDVTNVVHSLHRTRVVPAGR